MSLGRWQLFCPCLRRPPGHREAQLDLHISAIWKTMCDHDKQFLEWWLNFYFPSVFGFQSNYLYTDNARKMRDKYKVVLDTPEYRTVQELKTHLSEVRMSPPGMCACSEHLSGNYTRQRSPFCLHYRVATTSKQVNWSHFASVYFCPLLIKWGYWYLLYVGPGLLRVFMIL